MGNSQKIKLTLNEFYQNELPILGDIINFNSNLFVSAYTNTTGVKTPETVFRGTLFSRNRFNSEEYLLNYKKSGLNLSMSMGVMSYRERSVLESIATRNLKETEDSLIKLPTYKNIKAPIGSVIRSRRSIKQFTSKRLDMEDVATLLFYASGISGEYTLEGASKTATLGQSNQKMYTRMVSSGGGLYPIDLYFIPQEVKDLKDNAVYKYVPEKNSIKEIRNLKKDFSYKHIAQLENIDNSNANLFLIYVYKIYENSRKYGDTGLVFALLEAGGISQNVHLVCTSLNYGSCDIGGFDKHKIEALLDIDGLSQHVIHSTIIGA